MILSSYVLAEGPDGVRVLLSPNDPVPDWAAESVTNPKAWVEPPEPRTKAKRATS